MSDNETRVLLFLVFVGLVLLAVSFALPVICEGQETSSQGFLDTSGWRSAEYQLAQCGPSGCGPRGCQVPGLPPTFWNPPPPGRFNAPTVQQQPVRPQPQRTTSVKRIAAVVFIKSTIVTNAMAGESNSKLGSGTYIGNGYVITCGHILREGWAPVVYFANTGLPEKPFPATIIAADASIDLGLLRITPLKNDSEYAMLLAPSNAGIGETVWWAGFGQGSFSAGSGRVTQYIGQEIHIATTVRNGDSGGPLFTSAGLVGVISEGETNVDIGGASVEYIRQWITSVTGGNKPSGTTEQPSTVVVPSPSAPAGQSPPATNAVPDGGAAGTAGNGGAGANAEQWANKLADSIDALLAEMAKIKAGSSVNVEQAVSQAVTVQTEQFGRQLIDKELVPLRSRVDQIELQQQALQLLVEAGGGKGEKGDRGEQGLPGKDAVVDLDELAAAVSAKLPPGASETQPIGFVDRYMRLDPNGTHEYKGQRYSLAEEKAELVYPGQTRVTYLYPLIQGGVVPSGN